MSLMAQIRNDVKGSKRTLSADIELSHAPPRGREPDSDNENPVTDRSLGGETEMIDSRDLPGYAFNLSVSSTGSYGRPIVSPKKVLRRLDAQRGRVLNSSSAVTDLNSAEDNSQYNHAAISTVESLHGSAGGKGRPGVAATMLSASPPISLRYDPHIILKLDHPILYIYYNLL